MPERIDIDLERYFKAGSKGEKVAKAILSGRWYSKSKLAERCGVSLATVPLVESKLAEAGVVFMTKRSGRQVRWQALLSRPAGSSRRLARMSTVQAVDKLALTSNPTPSAALELFPLDSKLELDRVLIVPQRPAVVRFIADGFTLTGEISSEFAVNGEKPLYQIRSITRQDDGSLGATLMADETNLVLQNVNIV